MLINLPPWSHHGNISRGIEDSTAPFPECCTWACAEQSPARNHPGFFKSARRNWKQSIFDMAATTKVYTHVYIYIYNYIIITMILIIIVIIITIIIINISIYYYYICTCTWLYIIIIILCTRPLLKAANPPGTGGKCNLSIWQGIHLGRVFFKHLPTSSGCGKPTTVFFAGIWKMTWMDMGNARVLKVVLTKKWQ